MKNTDKRFLGFTILLLMLILTVLGGGVGASAQSVDSSLYVLNSTHPLNKAHVQRHASKMVPLEKVLKKLERTHHITFVYESGLVGGKTVPHKVLGSDHLGQKVGKLLVRAGLTYRKTGRGTYVIRRLSGLKLKEVPEDPQVSGTVTNAQTGDPMIGVNILVVGTSTGKVTDANGYYSLTVPSLQDTLRFSFIGFQTKTVPIGGRTTINVALQPTVLSGQQMVVIGYGAEKQANVTGAQSTVSFNNDEIETLPVTDVGQALTGKVSGVRIIKNSGQPGSTSTIQIRGINSISANTAPLIVLNGVPMPNYNLSMINPIDVKSIRILKDAASSAIYGSQAAGGVVLITTKKGKAGKNQVSINYSYGFQHVVGKRDVMNTKQYAQAAIDAAQNGWIDSGGDPDAPNTIKARGSYKYVWPEILEHPEKLPDTNWQDVIYRTVPIQKANVIASGGTKNGTTYSISGGYINQKGIVLHSHFKKYSFNARLSNKVNKWLKIGGMANVNYGEQRLPYPRIIEWALQYPPIYPVYGEDGHLGRPASLGIQKWSDILFRPFNGHPFYRIHDRLNQDRATLVGNLHANLDIFEGLDFKTSFNYYYHSLVFNNYAATFHDLGPAHRSQGMKSVTRTKVLNYDWQNLLTYKNDFNNVHNIGVTIGYEFNKTNNFRLYAQRNEFSNDLVPYLPAGKTVTGASQGLGTRVLMSFFGRLNYNYKNKYIITASMRYDGSSRFGPDNKWGAFPAVSAGWRISNETFMRSMSAVSNLKLRASYGLVGNDNFGNYRWISPLSRRKVAMGNNLLSTYVPTGFTSPNLKWEKTKEFDVGIDLGLFRNRFTLSGDYYYSKTVNLLLSVPIPSITGYTSVFRNAGKLQNRGVELNLKTRNFAGRFEWTTNFSIAHNQNEILELGKTNAMQTFHTSLTALDQVNKVGHPIYSYYTYLVDGIYMNQAEINNDPASYPGADPGDAELVDVNDDGKLTPADRKIIGSYEPDFTWSLSNTFRYKGFSLSVMFVGADGGLLFDHDLTRQGRWHEGRNYVVEMTNRWRSPENPGKYHKLTTLLNGMDLKGSTYFLYSGSYIRLKTLTLGYNFNQTLISNLGLNKLRIYFTGRNIFTRTAGPEINPVNNNQTVGCCGTSSNDRVNNGGGARFRGVVGYAYPSAAVYSIGLNISF